jgi:aryl-alcohol dehydrogenase-like predicted oxidoreductase
MVHAVEASLGRLRTDHVDVLFAHFPDGITPMDEILAGFDDLIRAGKVLHGGLSNFPAWRVAGAAIRADARNLAPLVGIEIEYNLAERSAERELLPMAEAHGLGAALYSPLASGLLTGKYRRGEGGRLNADGILGETRAQTAVVDAILDLANETGTDAVSVSLSWLRAQAARSATGLFPVVGPRTLDQLRQYLASLEMVLTEDQYRRLDDVSAVRLGVPHESVARALRAGLDGDRSRLDENVVPVI